MVEESSQGSIPPHPGGSPYSYPQKGSKATPAFSGETTPLLLKIQSRISRDGPMRFRDYMAMALYDPEFGYYAVPSQRVGKEGDFITSVTVGNCFGLILARRLWSCWEEMGKPEKFHIIEPGAHNGVLCQDILTEIQSCSPEFFEAVYYHLIEATSALTMMQQERLAGSFAGKFTTHASISELNGLIGAVISNELVDAFPVDLVKFEDGQWWQLNVENTETGLQFTNTECDDRELRAFCKSLGDHYPDGYTTEYNSGITQFVNDAASALAAGLLITVDYGHEARDYYHPDRTSGTLQTYYNHKKSDDPLCFPGQIDITSHVDFSRLMSTAESAGFAEPLFKTQASYLTQHAKSWLISLETTAPPGTPALLRQFQTLTHPAMLGTKFMVCEMTKG